MESFVGVVTAVISISVDAVVVVDSSDSVQELTVKLKIMERIISICLTKFPNRSLYESTYTIIRVINQCGWGFLI